MLSENSLQFQSKNHSKLFCVHQQTGSLIYTVKQKIQNSQHIIKENKLEDGRDPTLRFTIKYSNQESMGLVKEQTN